VAGILIIIIIIITTIITTIIIIIITTIIKIVFPAHDELGTCRNFAAPYHCFQSMQQELVAYERSAEGLRS